MDQNVPAAVHVGVEDLRAAETLLQVWVEAPDAWLNSNDRRHRHAHAKLVKTWRQAAADATPEGWPAFDHPVRIVASIWKAQNRAYDAGNLYPTAKACVDGFRDSGILVEDSNEYVVGPDMRHGGKGVPGLLFLITKIDQNIPISDHFEVELNKPTDRKTA